MVLMINPTRILRPGTPVTKLNKYRNILKIPSLCESDHLICNWLYMHICTYPNTVYMCYMTES